MPVARVANTEPLPGYRLIEPLEQGGFGEAWKCQTPGGLFRSIQFVGGRSRGRHQPPGTVRQDPHALAVLRTLRHPSLIAIERVEEIDGELLILSELADGSLHDLLLRYQAEGKPGIPRDELLTYLRAAAEILDLLNQDHDLQHLSVEPRNLLLVGQQLKVGHFGQERLAPLYAAPERFTGPPAPTSDQYSLAISYVELLTGSPPFAGTGFQELARKHSEEEPNLAGLPDADRATVRKALAKDPRNRYGSCTAWILSLASPGSVGTRPVRKVAVPDPGTPLVSESGEAAARLSDRVPAVHPSALVEASPRLDPLENWTYVDCLGRFSFGEFWRVRPPGGGEDRVAKMVFGFDPKKDPSGRDPLDRLRQLRHPNLVPTECYPTPGRLILLSEYYPRSLVERFEESIIAGQAGIPREELLAHLGEVAHTLDDLRERPVHLQHLGLNPRQLVLDDEDRIKIADFGLVELVWKPAGQDPADLNVRYSAPELFAGHASLQSDQYSLALIFAELLTGGHPFRNLSQRQLSSVRSRGQPDLSMAPAKDRPILMTALDQDPRVRFRSCRELIDALVAASPSERGRGPTGARLATIPLPPLMRWPALNRVLRQLTEQAAGDLQVREFGQQRYLLLPGVMISHHCFARIVASTVPLKLEGFREQWQARPIREDGVRFQYQVRFPPNLLERFLGRHPGLETTITIEDIMVPGATLASLHIELRPISCGRARGADLLEEMGPVLLDSLRNCLQAAPERRKQERFPFAQQVNVYPLYEEDELGEAIIGQAHDVSLQGLGLYLPDLPHGANLAVHLRAPGTQGVLMVGQVVRLGQCRDGRHDIGLCFGDLPPT